MDASVWVAVITGIATVLAVIIGNNKHSMEMDAKLDKQQAVTETKIDHLTEEVKKHNNFAQRVPELEASLRALQTTTHELSQKVSYMERSMKS